jgi:hypothetical protein
MVADAVLGRSPREDVPAEAFLPDRFASYSRAA